MSTTAVYPKAHGNPPKPEIITTAKGLAEQGYTVAIYDHGHVEALPGASDYRQVAKYWPDGRVDHNASPP